MINGKLLADMLQNDHFTETRVFFMARWPG